MDKDFIGIVQKIIAEQGKEVFLNAAKCKALLADYTHNEYKKESRLLLQALEAGVANTIDATQELEICKKQQVQHLQDEYFWTKEISADVVETIALVLEKKEPPRCRQCGKELQEGWVSCPHCGAGQNEPAIPQPSSLPEAVTPQTPPAASTAPAQSPIPPQAAIPKPGPQPEPAAPAAEPAQPYVTPQTAPVTSAAPPAKKRTLHIALIAAGIAVVTGIGIWAWYRQSHKVPADFVYIKGGTFTMGSPSFEPERFDNEWQHQVTLSSFYMGKYEVTQAEWTEVMGDNPSYFQGGDLPVEMVSWYDAVEYCNRRSEREGLMPAYTIDKSRKDPNNEAPVSGAEYEWQNDGVRWTVTWNKNANGYRLPTEAEWEYACRAGTTTPFSTGNNITTDQANYNGEYPYNGNAKGTFREKTTLVGSFAPNAWGLYDMHGNVFEWCWDWYGDYSSGDYKQPNPTGAVSGSDRVDRGGSWIYVGRYLRSAIRDGSTPADRSNDLGFRLVRPEF